MLIAGDIQKENMWQLASRLFPIHRSICGPGITKVLDIIKEDMPLKVCAYPTGMVCGTWTVPPEWDVDEAYVETLSGKRVLDFSDHCFHVWLHSRPFEGIVSRDVLLQHLKTWPRLPHAIPVGYTFYRDNWGMSTRHNQLAEFTEPEYRVVIRTRLFDGFLRIGEAILPGETPEEIIIDAYICHPCLANDNQSGTAVAVELFKLLAQMPRRRYTYRLVLCPETVGPTVYIHQNKHLLSRAVGGYTFTSVGDPGPFHYRSSYSGKSVTDRAMNHALRHCGIQYFYEPFDVKTGTTGNERPYNAPGFFLPVGSLRRTHIGVYPELGTTTDDNLESIDANSMLDSLNVTWRAIQALERNVVYAPRFTGELFMTKFGLFVEDKSARVASDYLKGFVDGKNSLLDIADKSGLFVTAFDHPVKAFLEHKLIERVG